jgi:hypothetical protein
MREHPFQDRHDYDKPHELDRAVCPVDKSRHIPTGIYEGRHEGKPVLRGFLPEHEHQAEPLSKPEPCPYGGLPGAVVREEKKEPETA